MATPPTAITEGDLIQDGFLKRNSPDVLNVSGDFLFRFFLFPSFPKFPGFFSFSF